MVSDCSCDNPTFVVGALRALLAKAQLARDLLIISTDYSLANPDTLTKYKTAAQISQKVLETVAGRRLQVEHGLGILNIL